VREKKMRIYESVTRSIIEEMERGAVPWVRPWKTNRHNAGSVIPANAITGRSYSGINVPILWASADSNGYPTHAWMTFKQAETRGAHVRKGERGTHVVFTKLVDVKGDDDEIERRSMLREYTVFNVAQIEDFAMTETPLPPESERLAAAEAFVAATKADIRYGGDKACFVPSLDFVAIPVASSFTSIASFYATALHELGHWSGHKSRLDRDLSGRFGSSAYAAEELVAEFAAAFLCAHLGITGELRHAGYIANWLDLLRRDNRAIFTAASKASQAADYLRSFSGHAANSADDAI
jgi:antirestriction protein ArdC